MAPAHTALLLWLWQWTLCTHQVMMRISCIHKLTVFICILPDLNQTFKFCYLLRCNLGQWVSSSLCLSFSICVKSRTYLLITLMNTWAPTCARPNNSSLLQELGTGGWQVTLFMESLAQHIKAREGQRPCDSLSSRTKGEGSKRKGDCGENGPGGTQGPNPNSIPSFFRWNFLSLRDITNTCLV